MEATAQTPPASAEGISTVGALRRISETFLSVLHNRLELLTLELKEEKHWAVATLVLAVMAGSFATLSVVAIFVTVAFLVPPAARPWALLGICVLTIGGLVFCLFRLRSILKRPPMLCDTLEELKKDIACLKES
jgi:uncharacterized membrane protein YqjE